MFHRVNALFVIYLTSLSAVSSPAIAVTNGLSTHQTTSTMSNAATSRVFMEVMAHLGGGEVIAQAPNSAESAPPPSNAANSLLQSGSRGAAVSRVQGVLQRLGYYENDPDGIFGEQTRAAVLEFQRQAGLPTTGEVDSITLEQLQAANEARPETESPSPFNDAPLITNDAETGDTERTETPPPPTVETTKVGTVSPRQGRFWWMAALIAASAALGFGLYRLTRPRIHRLAAKPSAIAPSEAADTGASHTGRSPDTNGTTPLSSVRVESTATTHRAETGTASPTFLDNTYTDGSAIQPEIAPLNETTRLAKIDIVDELIHDLRGADPSKRRKAIWELGQLGDSKAVQPLVDLMMDSDSSQRSLILAAISEIGVSTLKPMNRALLLSLQDHSADVRKNAIRDVTRVYDLMSQMSELLAHAASDPDAEVQETAQWALGQLGRIRNVPELGNGSAMPNKAPEHLPGDV